MRQLFLFVGFSLLFCETVFGQIPSVCFDFVATTCQSSFGNRPPSPGTQLNCFRACDLDPETPEPDDYKCNEGTSSAGTPHSPEGWATPFLYSTPVTEGEGILGVTGNPILCYVNQTCTGCEMGATFTLCKLQVERYEFQTSYPFLDNRGFEIVCHVGPPVE